MKNIFLIIISFILLSNVSKAQLDDNTKQQIVLLDFLMKSPVTYVVLEDSAICAYNDAIKYAVGRHWKINKIEYITVAEYKKKKLVNAPYIKRSASVYLTCISVCGLI